eukprot:2166723-Amphidinium_carterae.1
MRYVPNAAAAPQLPRAWTLQHQPASLQVLFLALLPAIPHNFAMAPKHRDRPVTAHVLPARLPV